MSSSSNHFLLPGVGFVADLAKKLLGFDATSIFNFGLLLAACSTALHFSRELFYAIASVWCIHSIEVEGMDPVHSYLIRWMTVHKLTVKSRIVKATAAPQNTEADYEEPPLFREEPASIENHLGENTLREKASSTTGRLSINCR